MQGGAQGRRVYEPWHRGHPRLAFQANPNRALGPADLGRYGLRHTYMKTFVILTILFLCSCNQVESNDFQNIDNSITQNWPNLQTAENGYSIVALTSKGAVAVVNGDVEIKDESFTHIGKIRPNGPYIIVPSKEKVLTKEQAIIEAKRCYNTRNLLNPNNEPD